MLIIDSVNSLWPSASDAIWWHRSGSTLAQVLARFLRAPSHYLNQCWLIINEVQWQHQAITWTSDIYLRALSREVPQPTIIRIPLKINLSKISFKSPRSQWVNGFQPNVTCQDDVTLIAIIGSTIKSISSSSSTQLRRLHNRAPG